MAGIEDFLAQLVASSGGNFVAKKRDSTSIIAAFSHELANTKQITGLSHPDFAMNFMNIVLAMQQDQKFKDAVVLVAQKMLQLFPDLAAVDDFSGRRLVEAEDGGNSTLN